MEPKLKPVFCAALLAGLLALAYQVLSPFLSSLAWAAVLAYATWPLREALVRRLGGNTGAAALGMVLILLAAIIVPAAWLSYLLQDELSRVYQELGELLTQRPSVPAAVRGLPVVGEYLQNWLEQLADPGILRARILPWLKSFSSQFLRLLGNVGYNAARLAIVLFSVFFFYRDGPLLMRQISQVLRRLMGGRSEAYLATAGTTVKAVVYGLVLTAIGQGAVAGLGYGFVGLASPVLLTLITMLLALIPFGTPLAWGGAGLWLLLQGRHLAGIELLIWGAAVVSWVDNVIRPLVISNNTRIPFLLVFFGVLGGLAAFGFIGLFVGPVILALLLAVWREWLDNAAALDDDPAAAENKGTEPN